LVVAVVVAQGVVAEELAVTAVNQGKPHFTKGALAVRMGIPAAAAQAVGEAETPEVVVAVVVVATVLPNLQQFISDLVAVVAVGMNAMSKLEASGATVAE
jgi:hypothetical protein